ncbi:MAG TPA: amidohydrolase [Planctomycetota bacterium]|nr:amidohydrolase [Planctomycetota bacterium]
MNISPEVKSNTKELIAIRRTIHQNPEQGFKEFKTAALIRSRLKGWGIEHKSMCGTGTVALIKGSRPGPTMLIRADMDALPVLEKNTVPYCSRNKGVMHACGHDGHTAMALMAAKLLHKRRTAFRGNLKIMFQPAEEGPGGAGPMIDEGLLRGPKVDAAFAIHMWNDLPTGRLGVRSGPVFASADEFRIKIVGRGGHGAAPHQTVDPVAAAAQVITACQNIVSRKVDPTKSAVVTFGQIHGGTRHNIIPDVVDMTGTVRAFEEPVRRLLQREIPKVAGGVASALGAKVDFSYHRGYPPTINEEAMTDLVRDSVREAAGTAAAVEQDVSMGAEDMSLVLQEVPGCYFFLGSMNPRKGLVYPHHSAQFNFDEEALPLGVETWLRLAQRFLNVA